MYFIPGIGVALQSRLASFINNPELITDIQPRSIRVLSVPDYYAEYHKTGNGYAAFLGSSITAKVSRRRVFSSEKFLFNRSFCKDHLQRAKWKELRLKSGLYLQGTPCHYRDDPFSVVKSF